MNWTNRVLVPTATMAEVSDDERFKTASLFTGVAGIELGLGHAFRSVLMCDKDVSCIDVLTKLQRLGHLPHSRC